MQSYWQSIMEGVSFRKNTSAFLETNLQFQQVIFSSPGHSRALQSTVLTIHRESRMSNPIASMVYLPYIYLHLP